MASADHGVGTRRAHIADAIAAADAARRPRRAGAFYSHFVAFLKLLLPMIAAALMLIVIIWPEITSRDEGFRIGVADISVEDAKNLRMVNPRYMNIDKVGQPYVLSADETTQATGDDQLVRLKRPKADITLKDGTWIALNADFGNFYRTDKLLDLFGSVNLYQDQGYEFHTTRARFDLTKGHASGQEAVQGQGPFGTVESQGFRILNNGKSILFTGRSHMVILPGA
ncbi:MAG: LPS export ABC transporter periplasmic protein LptC, partial [Kiloniellales bacterium]